MHSTRFGDLRGYRICLLVDTLILVNLAELQIHNVEHMTITFEKT